MAAVIDRKTGALLSVPTLTPEQQDRMAEAIADAMIMLSRSMIADAVEDYVMSLQKGSERA